MTTHDALPPVLDPTLAWGPSLTPRSVPTVRPTADECADFERAVREEGEPSARLGNLARVAGRTP